MSAHDGLQRASFDGLEFPFTKMNVRGKYRLHTHEYLKTPGGLNEKMARGLYTVEFQAVFDANITNLNGGTLLLYPDVLNSLRDKYERGITGSLVIPSIGTIQAIQTDWNQEMDAKIRSGEKAPLTFLEDNSEEALTSALSEIDTTSVASNAFKLDSLANELDPKPTIFDTIQEMANAVFALRDQGNLFGARLEAQVLALTGIIHEADRTLDELQNPVNYRIVDAMHELLDSLLTLSRVASKTQEAGKYTVPMTMTVGQISTAIFGDTSHALEIMQNNYLDDPLAVPAGTVIVFFRAEGVLVR